MKASTLIKIWIAIWATIFMIGVVGLMITNAHAQSFDDRWTSGTVPVLTTPNVVTIAPQIAVNPQITITPQITVNPPTVTITPNITLSPPIASTTTSGVPAAKAPTPIAPPLSSLPKAQPQMAPIPRPHTPPRIIVRRYYDNDYPMTDLSVPADRVLRSDRPGCNGIACYP